MNPLISLQIRYPSDLTTETDKILDWVENYVPQTNTNKKPWYGPEHTGNPEHEQPREGFGKIVVGGQLSLVVPNTYNTAQQLLSALPALQAAADAAGCRDALDAQLLVGAPAGTFNFDHPDDGVIVPDGWDWSWTLISYRWNYFSTLQGWRSAGYTLTSFPSIALADQKAGGPCGNKAVGWLRANGTSLTGERYTFMPDLRKPACRAWLVQRMQSVMAECNTKVAGIGMKSGWLHGDASIQNTPALPRGDRPWLASPYPGDSYRDAVDLLALELAAAIGGENVVATNTGIPAPGVDPHLPDYVRRRDGGLADLPSGEAIKGYWVTNITFAHRWFTDRT